MSTTTKRKGRGRSVKSMALIQAAIRILQEIQPCSIRAVCYRLFTEKLIPDMGKRARAQWARSLSMPVRLA